MEKTIVIDGKPIRFKSTAATPLRYKAQFKKDFFAEILKMGAIEKLSNIKNLDKIKPKDIDSLDFEVFYNIAWVMAKAADPSIPDPMSWLDRFESFPMIEIIPELMDLIMANFHSEKK